VLNREPEAVKIHTMPLLAGADPGILERGPGKGAKPRRRERRRGAWGLPQRILKN